MFNAMFYIIQFMVKYNQFLLFGVPRKLWVMEPMFALDFGSGEPNTYGAGEIMLLLRLNISSFKSSKPEF